MKPKTWMGEIRKVRGNWIAGPAVRTKSMAVVLALLFSIHVPLSHAQLGSQILCDDVFGVRYAVFNTPTPSGVQQVISPINRPLNMYPIAVLDGNPLIALGHMEPDGFGVLIGRDGGFTIASGGQYYPTGRCAVVPFGPDITPPPVGAILQPSTAPPIMNNQGIDVANLAPNDNWLAGHWPLLATESEAMSCKKKWEENGDQDELFDCINHKMLTHQQIQGIDCLDLTGTSSQVSCVAKLAYPGAGDTIDLIQGCTNDTDVDWKCVAKQKLSDPQYQALQCAAAASSPVDAASCIEGLGFDADTNRALSVISKCASEEADITSTTACVLSSSGDKNVASAAQCVEDQLQTAEFSTVGAAACYATRSIRMNPELQIAVECAAESDGDPLAFAGCTGGRLTVRELKKCLYQIGGSGCFGPNNDIVKTLNQYGVNTRNLTNPDGELVKAWNTVTNDVEHGIGPNNDILHFAIQIGNVSQSANNLYKQQINNIVHDAMYGPGPNNTLVVLLNQAGTGAQHQGDQAKKFINRTFGLRL